MSCSRLFGQWAILVGFAVMGWALLALPWNEHMHSPDEWTTIIPSAGAPTGSDGDPNAIKMPGMPTEAADDRATNIPVDTHEYRAGSLELAASGFDCILPGALLVIFARHLGRLDLWAYLATCAICIGFVGFYSIELFALIPGVSVPIHLEPIISETLLRPGALLVFVVCLNAMPEAWDEFRSRRRQRHRDRRLQSNTPTPMPARIPPRPSTLLPPTGRY